MRNARACLSRFRFYYLYRRRRMLQPRNGGPGILGWIPRLAQGAVFQQSPHFAEEEGTQQGPRKFFPGQTIRFLVPFQ